MNFATQRSAAPAVPSSPSKKPRIESHDLFRGKSEIVIVHEREEYRLRITRNGKLLLTK